jgi:stringent starvation protein B
MADGDTSTDSGTAMTVSEAASVFSSILAREDGQPVAEKPKKQVEASEPSDEEADASDEVDETRLRTRTEPPRKTGRKTRKTTRHHCRTPPRSPSRSTASPRR